MSQNAEFIRKVTPTPASGRGWHDFVEGRGFPAEYDGWNQIEQRHYEHGRLRAAGWPGGRSSTAVVRRTTSRGTSSR